MKMWLVGITGPNFEKWEHEDQTKSVVSRIVKYLRVKFILICRRAIYYFTGIGIISSRFA